MEIGLHLCFCSAYYFSVFEVRGEGKRLLSENTRLLVGCGVSC